MRPTVLRQSPPRRMVEPKNAGHGRSSFGHRHGRLCLFHFSRRPRGTPKGVSGGRRYDWREGAIMEPNGAPGRARQAAWLSQKPRGHRHFPVGHRYGGLCLPSVPGGTPKGVTRGGRHHDRSSRQEGGAAKVCAEHPPAADRQSGLTAADVDELSPGERLRRGFAAASERPTADPWTDVRTRSASSATTDRRRRAR